VRQHANVTRLDGGLGLRKLSLRGCTGLLDGLAGILGRRLALAGSLQGCTGRLDSLAAVLRAGCLAVSLLTASRHRATSAAWREKHGASWRVKTLNTRRIEISPTEALAPGLISGNNAREQAFDAICQCHISQDDQGETHGNQE
jgi:hypothetical protein